MPKSEEEKIAGYIEALQRRLAFLRARIKDKPDLTYDRREAGALRWILGEAGIPETAAK